MHGPYEIRDDYWQFPGQQVLGFECPEARDFAPLVVQPTRAEALGEFLWRVEINR